MARTAHNSEQPVVKLRLDDSSYQVVLADALIRAGCVLSAVDDVTLAVVNPEARDAEEARTELVFFVRAWQSRHPQVWVTVS